MLVPNPRDKGSPEREEDGEQIAPVDEGQIIVTILEDGAPLPGACVALDDGSSVISVCDDAADDESGDAGQIKIGVVAPGDYTLTVTPPDGFDAPSPATIQVTAGPNAPIDRPLSRVTPENGSLSIVADDLEDGGDRLPMACYTVEIPPEGQAFGPFCDEDGDGEVTVQGVTPGPIAVVESSPPPDTEPAEPCSPGGRNYCRGRSRSHLPPRPFGPGAGTRDRGNGRGSPRRHSGSAGSRVRRADRR